jgi:hypothetical protein
VAANRGDPERLTHWNVKALSPNGKILYFGTYLNANDPQLDRIVALDLATGRYRDVFKFPVERSHLPASGQHLSLAVHPSNDQIAVHAWDPADKVARLFTVRADGSDYTELMKGLRGGIRIPKLTWSADGRWVYFTVLGDKDERGEEKHRVMRIAAAGGTPEFTGIEVTRLLGSISVPMELGSPTAQIGRKDQEISTGRSTSARCSRP